MSRDSYSNTVFVGVERPDSYGIGAMARQNAIKKSKRTVDALTVETGDAVFWGRGLSGFGVRVYATERKVYVVQTRVSTGNLRRVTIDHAPEDLDRAHPAQFTSTCAFI